VSTAGNKIIESLKQAVAGDFSRVTVDGVTWVRLDEKEQKPYQSVVNDIRTILKYRTGWEGKGRINHTVVEVSTCDLADWLDVLTGGEEPYGST
jgi:hypothetical protein